MNPNQMQAPRPPRPRPSSSSQNISTLAQQAPNIAQVSPATIGNLGSLELPADEQLNIAAQLELMQWAGNAQRRFEALDSEEARLNAIRAIPEEDLELLMQFGAIKQEELDALKPWYVRFVQNATPNAIITGLAKTGLRALDWLDQKRTQTYRTWRETNESQQGGSYLARWRRYWQLTGQETAQGNYGLQPSREIAANNGWDYDTQQVLFRAGVLHRKNWLHDGEEGREQARQLVSRTVSDMVFEGLLESEEAVDLQQRVTTLLEDNSQLDAFRNLLGVKRSFGRDVAHTVGLDPHEQKGTFNFVSGGFDLAFMFADPTIVGSKVNRAYQAARWAVKDIDDVLRVSVGTVNRETIQELAVSSYRGNVSEAAATWMAANPDQVNGNVRRLAERIRTSWNEDVAASAARMAGDTPAERTAGYARLHQENPVLASYAQDLWQYQMRWETSSAVSKVERGANRSISPIQQADRIAVDAQEIGIDAVYRAMLDVQTIKNITSGKYGGYLRIAQTMPMLSQMGAARNSMKAAMRQGIDWLNDSNYRMVERLWEAGKFESDEAAKAAMNRAGAQMGTKTLLGGTVRTFDPATNSAGTTALQELSAWDRVRMFVSQGAQSAGTVATFFTRQYPGSRIYDIMDEQSVKQVESMAAMLPSQIGEHLTNLYANATTAGERVLILRGLFSEMFARNGLYDTDNGRALAEYFLDKQMLNEILSEVPEEARRTFQQEAGHIYSVGGLDRVLLDNGSESGAAIFGWQTSNSVAIPDFKRLFALSRRSSFWANALGVNLNNSKFMDKLVSGVWAPAVLLRLGFPLRAGGEEALQFAMRRGFGTYVRAAYLSRIAMHRRGRAMRAKDPSFVWRPKREGYVSLGDLAKERRVPATKGNYAMLWLAEQLDKLPWNDSSFAEKFATRAENAGSILGMAWLGNWWQGFKGLRPEVLDRWGVKALHDRWIGDAVGAIDELVKASDGDFVAAFMGDASSRNMSGSKYAAAQISGSDVTPQSVSPHGILTDDDAGIIKEIYDHRWGVFALDSDFGYENYQRFLWQVSQSDDPLDEVLYRYLMEAEEAVEGTPRLVMDELRSRFDDIIHEIETTPELDGAFKRLARSQVTVATPDDVVAALRLAPHGEQSLLPTDTPNGRVLFWHGTTRPLPRDQRVVGMLEDQADISETVRRFHTWRIRSQEADFYRGQSEALGRTLAEVDEMSDPRVTETFLDALTASGAVADEVLTQPGMPTRAQLNNLRQHIDAYGYDDFRIDGLGEELGDRDLVSLTDLYLGPDFDPYLFIERVMGDGAVTRTNSELQALRSEILRERMGKLYDQRARLIPPRLLGLEGDDLFRELSAYQDDLARRLDSTYADLQEEADWLWREQGIDVNGTSTDGLTPSQQEELTTLQRELAQLEEDQAVALDRLDEADAGVDFNHWAEVMEELDNQIGYVLRRIEKLEAQDAVYTLGKNDLDAIALNDRRFIDSSGGTGGMWFGNGMYATDNLDEAIGYSLHRQADSGKERLYGLGFEGEWKPLNLDEPLPPDAHDAVMDMVTNVMKTVDDTTFMLMAASSDVPLLMVRRDELPDGARRIWDVYADRLTDGQQITGYEVHSFFDMLSKSLRNDRSFEVGRNTGNKEWLDAVDMLQSRLQGLGYTGYFHQVDGMAGDAGNYIIFDADRIRVASEWSALMVEGYGQQHASRSSALRNLLELRAREIELRTHLVDDGNNAVAPLTDTLFRDLKNGDVPTADELRRLNYEAQAQGLVNLDKQALWMALSFSKVPGSKVAEVYEKYGMMGQYWDSVYHRLSSDELQRLTDDMVDAFGEEIPNVVELVKQHSTEITPHLFEQVIAPLTRSQKRSLARLVFNKPFELIGGVIDGISRHPLFVYHYVEGYRSVADAVFSGRQAERGLLDRLAEVSRDGFDSVDYARDLLRRGSRDVDFDLAFVTDETGPLARVAPREGRVTVNSAKVADDFDRRLPYLFGEMDSAGARQKAEVMHRLGVDQDELYGWMSRHGGAQKYEEFILEHQRAHIALGHRGVEEAAWLSNHAIHQQVEATWVALHKIGAGHLAEVPVMGMDIFDLVRMLDDTKASARRLRKEGLVPDPDFNGTLTEQMLQDHPVWPHIKQVVDDARRNGFKQLDDETDFAFMERVLRRLQEAKTDHVELAATYAFRMTRPHVDSVAIASYGQTLLRNAMPFQWAHERFIKRSINTLRHSPESLKRLHMMYSGLRNIGFIYTDDRTGNDYFTYPGTQLMYEGVGEVVRAVYGTGLRRIGVQDDQGNELPDDLGLSEYLRMQARPFLTIPGLDDIGRPVLGPQFAILLRGIVNRFPVIGQFRTQRLAESLVGPISANPDRPAWQLIVPSVFTNMYRAANPYEEMASDSLAALSVLAANDLLPEDDDPQSWEVFDDRLNEQMKIIGWLRVVLGWVGVAPPEVRFDGSELQQELLSNLQNFGYEEGMSQFVRDHPDATAWQVFGTESVGGASIPATVEAWEFMQDNAELMEGYKHAAAYLVPRPVAGDGTDEFYQPAWSQQFAMDLRHRRNTEEMYQAIRFAQVAPAYFEERRQYEEARALMAGTPQAVQLDQLWGQRSLDYQRQHPTFWNELTSNERELKRNQIVTELNAIARNGQIPQTNTALATFTLLDGYNEFKGAMDSLRGKNDQTTRDFRSFLRQRFLQWAWQQVNQMPEGESFYYRVIIPEVSLPEEEIELIEQQTPQLVNA